MKFFFRDKLHLGEKGYRKFSLYILKILASTSQSFANSSPTYEYAIGEFEALSSSIISPEHSHALCNEVSSESFLLCQDDFPSLSAIVSSHIPPCSATESFLLSQDDFPSLSTVRSSSDLILSWSALSVSAVFTASCFPPFPISVAVPPAASTVVAVPSAAAVSSSVAACRRRHCCCHFSPPHSSDEDDDIPLQSLPRLKAIDLRFFDNFMLRVALPLGFFYYILVFLMRVRIIFRFRTN